MEETTTDRNNRREINFSKGKMADCALAVLYEFEVSDIVVVRAAGPATNDMYRIVRLLEYHGVKVIDTQRLTETTSDKYREKVRNDQRYKEVDPDSIPNEFVVMKLTLKRNGGVIE